MRAAINLALGFNITTADLEKIERATSGSGRTPRPAASLASRTVSGSK
jgi:hypothetical protein